MIIKEIAWSAFKNTGDINTYLEFSKLKNIEETLNIDENTKSKWNNSCRK